MSKSDFLHQLKSARNLLYHQVSSTRENLPPWLTNAVVRDFEAADFSELPADKLESLKEKIEQFSTIVGQVSSEESVTSEGQAAAAQSLQEISLILDAYLFNGSDWEQIQEALESVAWPEEVVTWDFEARLDSTDQPAVWIWVIVDPDAAEKDGFQQATGKIKQQIKQALQAGGIERWPYIRFRTAVEQRTLWD